MRGAVPMVLATFPVIEGVPGSPEFFNIAFFAVVLSTLVQGATIEPLARRLHMTTQQPGSAEAAGRVGDGPRDGRRDRRVSGGAG